MRIRKKKHTSERIDLCAEYFYKSEPQKKQPAVLEIGCGKGDFICETAQQFPDADFVAVEKISDVIVAAMEKAKSLNLSNVKFIVSDAKNLADYFPSNSIDTLYLNFSDPWHKRYQHNKRLTSPEFLGVYKKFMKPDAEIILKTDNTELFNYSLKTLPLNNFKITRKTYDLYASEFLDGNVQTEYEKKFVEQNIKICYLIAVLTAI